MARADKSARIIIIIDTIRKEEFINYSKIIEYFKYNYISIFKKIYRKIYSKKKINNF